MSRHKRISKDEVRALLTRVKLVWQWYVVEDVGVDLWHGALRAYTNDQANAGLEEYLRYGKKPPSPADIMDAADEWIDGQEVDRAVLLGAGDRGARGGGVGVAHAGTRVHPRMPGPDRGAPT